MIDWRLYFSDREVDNTEGLWDELPVVDVQVLMIRLVDDPDGRSRIGWYKDGLYQRCFHDCHFYAMFSEGPAGITPDAVLDIWQEKYGESNVRVGDLSLDDLRSIRVKCGRSISNEEFDPILARAINDPDFP